MPSVHQVTVSAPTNIAVIKYWGKADSKYNTPINSSVSVTLDQQDLKAVTTVATSPDFTRDRLWLNGTEDSTAADNKRFRACIDGVKELAQDKTLPDGTIITKENFQKWNVHVSSYNTFPTAAGLASSAAGYAALVAALAHLMNAKETFPNQLSTIARQGSGSACRSLYGGFVAWRQGSAEKQWLDSKAEQIAPESHWPEIRALICVVSDRKKDTSSTAGMSTSVRTSKLIMHRANHVVPERMTLIEKAWNDKDFPAFAQLTMQDSNQFHAVCLDTYPPIFYMNDVSRAIVRVITAYNEYYGTPKAAYTFDAGPNAVIYTLEESALEIAHILLRLFPTDNVHRPEFKALIENYQVDDNLFEVCAAGRTPQSGDVQMMYWTKAGPGPQVLDDADSNLDHETGLNTYNP